MIGKLKTRHPCTLLMQKNVLCPLFFYKPWNSHEEDWQADTM